MKDRDRFFVNTVYISEDEYDKLKRFIDVIETYGFGYTIIKDFEDPRRYKIEIWVYDEDKDVYDSIVKHFSKE